MSLAYEILEEEHNGSNLIKLTSGTFSGIIYSYGRVSFGDETDEGVRLNFQYDVHNVDEDTLDKDAFSQVIGDILIELITEGISKNEITYTGGIDENRTTDPEQSDL